MERIDKNKFKLTNIGFETIAEKLNDNRIKITFTFGNLNHGIIVKSHGAITEAIVSLVHKLRNYNHFFIDEETQANMHADAKLASTLV